MFQHAVRTLKLRLKSPLEKWIHSACNLPQFAAALVKHECAAAITARKRERT
jgi:hypothetical protein